MRNYSVPYIKAQLYFLETQNFQFFFRKRITQFHRDKFQHGKNQIEGSTTVAQKSIMRKGYAFISNSCTKGTFHRYLMKIDTFWDLFLTVCGLKMLGKMGTVLSKTFWSRFKLVMERVWKKSGSGGKWNFGYRVFSGKD